MEIAYYVHLNMGPNTGVYKKIGQQVETWKRLGHKAHLYVLTREEEIQSNLNNVATCLLYKKNRWKDRFIKLGLLIDRIINAKPDIVYMRQDHYYPSYRRLGKSLPVVVEINSNVRSEFNNYAKAQWLYNMLTERAFWKSCSGVVLVGKELSSQKSKTIRNLPFRVIANSLDLSQRFAVEPPKENSPPTLIFLGSSRMAWHGVDKVYRMAAAFPDWRFHIVGMNMLCKSQTSSNLVIHGALAEKNYIHYLKLSDIAISSLALHRIGVNEISPLKTREYLAYGLPVIIGYRDTDFPEDPDFLLRLENREDNVERNLSRIQDFVLRWKGKRVARERILRIDMLEKERERIEFFKSVIEQR